MDNRPIQKYIRQAKRIYHGDRKLKKQFIQDLEDALFCYTEKHPNCTYSDLTDEFGTPSEVRESLSDIVPDTLSKRNPGIYWFVITCCTILTLIVVGLTIRYVMGAYENASGYNIESLRDPDDPPLYEPDSTPIVEYYFD